MTFQPTTVLGIREADLRDGREVARLDAFVRAHPDATPFHLTGWSRAVQSGCGQRARYLVAERASGALAGVLPLTEVRSTLFGRALVSAGFGVGGGVLGEAVEELASGAWALARRLGCPSVEMRGGPGPAGWACDDTTYLGFVRPLGSDDDADLAAIPRKQRAEVAEIGRVVARQPAGPGPPRGRSITAFMPNRCATSAPPSSPPSCSAPRLTSWTPMC